MTEFVLSENPRPDKDKEEQQEQEKVRPPCCNTNIRKGIVKKVMVSYSLDFKSRAFFQPLPSELSLLSGRQISSSRAWIICCRGRQEGFPARGICRRNHLPRRSWTPRESLRRHWCFLHLQWDLSFFIYTQLFLALNNEKALDATILGNSLRYANHSTVNAYAKARVSFLQTFSFKIPY